MGNKEGRSSTGCALCRRRKIKCDEGRPGCRRCAQARKTCPGYPFKIPLDLKIPPGSLKQEASHTSSSVDFRPFPPHKPPSLSSESSRGQEDPEIKDEEDQSSTALLLSAPKHEPKSPPKYDIRHQSVCFFLHLFCYQVGRLYSFQVLDFIPDILRYAPLDSPVQLAATAVSRMTLADQYSGKDVRLQTGKEYGEALAVAVKAIQNPGESCKDETVVAVWLLGLYEQMNNVLNHGRLGAMSPEEEWQSHISHIRGAMNLLKLRALSNFESARSEKIFRIFKAAIQLRLFVLNDVTIKDFGDLELDLYQDEHEFVPSKTANKASAYFLKIARLTETIKNFLFEERDPDNDEFTSNEARRLVRYGLSLDEGMEGWSKVEPGWDMMPVRGDPRGTPWALYPQHSLFYFYSFWVYLYWIRYLIARVKLYEALIALVESDPMASGPNAKQTEKDKAEMQVEEYKKMIRATSAELIGLTAYALGDVANTGHFNSAISGKNPGGKFQEINVIAAMQLVIPLKALGRCRYTTSTQKGAIDLAISHIGDGFRRQPAQFV